MPTAICQKILARFRLPADLGGKANFTFPVSIMNDTGSNVQTIFPTDLAALRYNQLTYQGLLGPLCIGSESLRRREEKWHYNPTSCCVSCLMYGIRALVEHRLR